MSHRNPDPWETVVYVTDYSGARRVADGGSCRAGSMHQERDRGIAATARRGGPLLVRESGHVRLGGSADAGWGPAYTEAHTHTARTHARTQGTRS